MSACSVKIGFGFSSIPTQRLCATLNKGVYEKINRDIFCFLDCLC